MFKGQTLKIYTRNASIFGEYTGNHFDIGNETFVEICVGIDELKYINVRHVIDFQDINLKQLNFLKGEVEE